MSATREHSLAITMLALLLAAPVLQAQEKADKPDQAKPVENGGEVGKTPPPADKPAAPPLKVAAEPEGFVLQSASGDYRLQMNAILQADGRFFMGDSETAGHRHVPAAQRAADPAGHGRGKVRLHPGPGLRPGPVADPGRLPRRALLAQAAPASGQVQVALRPRAAPVGIQPAFVERALPTDIAPNRDVGVQLHGELGGVFGYAAAIVNGVPDGGSADLATGDAQGRRRPRLPAARSARGAVRCAVSASASRRPPGASRAPFSPSIARRARSRSSATRRVRSPTATARGCRPRPASTAGRSGSSPSTRARSRWCAGTRPSRHRRERGVAGAPPPGSSPGRRRRRRGVKPSQPFEPRQGQWGALELAARVHQLQVGDSAFDLGLADIKKSARRADGLGRRPQLVPEPQREVRAELRADAGSTAAPRPATARPRTLFFFRAQIAF